MTQVVFLPAARDDLRDAREWYSEQQPGLDKAFRFEVERVVEQISTNPRLYPIVRADVRRAITNRFPYKIFYRERGEEILVLAVRHHSRRPQQLTDAKQHTSTRSQHRAKTRKSVRRQRRQRRQEPSHSREGSLLLAEHPPHRANRADPSMRRRPDRGPRTLRIPCRLHRVQRHVAVRAGIARQIPRASHRNAGSKRVRSSAARHPDIGGNHRDPPIERPRNPGLGKTAPTRDGRPETNSRCTPCY